MPEVVDLYNKMLKETAGSFSVLELGCGFGDKLIFTNTVIRVGVDAYLPYITEGIERHRNVVFIHCDALNFLQICPAYTFDCLLIMDFLEHLEYEDAEQLILKSQKLFKKILFFVPEGEHPQTEDITGFGGHEWQTHRSTWYREDLEKFNIKVELWKDFHVEVKPESPNAMWGVWEAE